MASASRPCCASRCPSIRSRRASAWPSVFSTFARKVSVAARAAMARKTRTKVPIKDGPDDWFWSVATRSLLQAGRFGNAIGLQNVVQCHHSDELAHIGAAHDGQGIAPALAHTFQHNASGCHRDTRRPVPQHPDGGPGGRPSEDLPGLSSPLRSPRQSPDPRYGSSPRVPPRRHRPGVQRPLRARTTAAATSVSGENTSGASRIAWSTCHASGLCSGLNSRQTHPILAGERFVDGSPFGACGRCRKRSGWRSSRGR